jgi:peroxiredoxin
MSPSIRPRVLPIREAFPSQRLALGLLAAAGLAWMPVGLPEALANHASHSTHASLSPDETATPGVSAILAKADAAIAKAKTLTARITIEPIGGVAASLQPASSAVAFRRHDQGLSGWALAIKGERTRIDGTSEPIFAGFDGSTFRSTKPDVQILIEAAKPSRDLLVEHQAHWHADWLVRWDALAKAFANPEHESALRHAGFSNVDGVACEVVYIDYSELDDPKLMDAWWHLATSDGLPRRVDWHFYSEASGDGFVRVNLRDVKLDAPVSDSDLAIATPEGYTVEKQVAAPQAKAPRVKASEPSGPGVGTQAPDFALKNPAGETVSLKDLKGKVVLLDFWATWCPPCRAAMPGIQAIHEKYKDKGVVVLGMNFNDNGNPKAYMEKNKFTYGLLLNAETVGGVYGIGGIPHFVVIGPDGKIEYAGVGYGGKKTDEDIEAAIEKLVAKK